MIGKRLKMLREKKYSQEEFAKVLGVSASAIGMYEIDKREASDELKIKMCNILNCSLDYLLGTDIDDDKRYIPLLGTVKAGYDYLVNENIIDKIRLDPKFVDDGETYFALKVKGDSMEDWLHDGDIVTIRKQNTFKNNDFVVALINGEEATIKKAEINESNGIVTLVPMNKAYKSISFTQAQIENNELIILGIVKHVDKDF